ncbi:MAG: MFS transporter [Pseudomonadota bacterium]
MRHLLSALKKIDYKSPETMLLLMALALPLSHELWMTLLNNFVYEQAEFTGREIGILQSVREIPGFLSFAVICFLLVMREQTLALIALGLLGIGVSLTGFFPTAIGLYCTTFLMSIGFHYFETVHSSLTLQWIDKNRSAEVIGRQVSARAATSLIVFAFIFIAYEWLGFDWVVLYLCGGFATIAICIYLSFAYPRFETKIAQHKNLILRSRYWLYYLLTFMSGARRQIFLVFAGFLMVEKFGLTVSQIAILYALNFAISFGLAPKIGRLIQRWGEQKALIFEYVGLIIVFTLYAFVESAEMAIALYIIDHLFFAFAIAIKTYFQKIADPKDIASTQGVSFTINHIAAVVIPAGFGVIWIYSNALVFLLGAMMAMISLILSFFVPRDPKVGYETRYFKSKYKQLDHV